MLKELGITSCPVDPYAIADKIGVFVKEDDADGYAGMIMVEGQALISVRRSTRERTRKRFTVAHELGHYKIPGHLSPGVPSFRCSDEDLNTFQGHAKKEIEANNFAAELLMPEDHFRARIEGEDLGCQLIQELMNEYDTSLTATCLRYAHLQKSHALVCSSDGRVKWVYRGPEFSCSIRGHGKLHPESAAMKFFGGGTCPEEFETVPQDCWLEVLSFLAVCDEEEIDSEESSEYGELDGILRFGK